MKLVVIKRITKDKYEEIHEKANDDIEDINQKITDLGIADKEYYMTTSYLLDIGSRSSDIFSRSKPMEKRALLNFVLENRELDGEKVLYKAKFPFDQVLKYAPSSNWLPCLNAVRTYYEQEITSSLYRGIGTPPPNFTRQNLFI